MFILLGFGYAHGGKTWDFYTVIDIKWRMLGVLLIYQFIAILNVIYKEDYQNLFDYRGSKGLALYLLCILSLVFYVYFLFGLFCTYKDVE